MPTGLITIPATPEEIGAWLADSVGLTVSEPIEITVDGRTATAWDIEARGVVLAAVASSPVDGAAFWFQANEHHRIYAIPTGDDTMLGVTWGNAILAARGRSSSTEMNAATDDIVESMDIRVTR